jgi:phage/plasmid-like protein (TIGR03299 family)
MGQETAIWYNTMIKVGNTDKYKRAWHDDAALRASIGAEDNHFPGPIPMDVAEKFFDLHVSPREIWFTAPDGTRVKVDGYKAWATTDDNTTLGVHSDSYAGHQYGDWLLKNISHLVGGDVGLGAIGYLRNRAQAFCHIEVPETFKTPEGVDFRPFLMAATSFDGKLPSIYKRCITRPICDNTVDGAMMEKGQEVRVKHTRNSILVLRDAAQALMLLEDVAEYEAARIATQCQATVTDLQFDAFLAKLCPLPEQAAGLDINARDRSTRTATIAANKREKLNELYRQDGRAAPWCGTAFGVLQAVNTYQQHEATIRNAHEGRYARNMENAINGKSAEADNNALALLQQVLDRQLVAA